MDTKGKAIQVIPSPEEYDEVKTAAETTKRSLASFVLYSALIEARKVNGEATRVNQ